MFYSQQNTDLSVKLVKRKKHSTKKKTKYGETYLRLADRDFDLDLDLDFDFDERDRDECLLRLRRGDADRRGELKTTQKYKMLLATRLCDGGYITVLLLSATQHDIT